MNSESPEDEQLKDNKNESNSLLQENNKSAYSSLRMCNNNSKVTKNIIANSRESSHVEIFVNQFIKPEIKNSETPPLRKLRRKTSRKLMDFNLMIIGEPGIGKSTFIQSITADNSKKENVNIQTDENEIDIGNGLVSKSYSIVKETMKISLKVIQSHDYGKGLKSDTTFSNISDYIDGTFRECFKFECSLDRTSIEDRKIHCCLYFISPYGHSIKPLDIEFMKTFQTKLNIIPVIAKADTFTKTELETFKRKVLEDFQKHDIDLFWYYSHCDSFDDNNEDIQDMCEELKEKIPFSLILSNEFITNNRKQEERIRQYPWGTIKTDSSDISQFSFLENILLKSHINYFKAITKSVHYENYRVQYILQHVTDTTENPDNQ